MVSLLWDLEVEYDWTEAAAMSILCLGRSPPGTATRDALVLKRTDNSRTREAHPPSRRKDDAPIHRRRRCSIFCAILVPSTKAPSGLAASCPSWLPKNGNRRNLTQTPDLYGGLPPHTLLSPRFSEVDYLTTFGYPGFGITVYEPGKRKKYSYSFDPDYEYLSANYLRLPATTPRTTTLWRT